MFSLRKQQILQHSSCDSCFQNISYALFMFYELFSVLFRTYGNTRQHKCHTTVFSCCCLIHTLTVLVKWESFLHSSPLCSHTEKVCISYRTLNEYYSVLIYISLYLRSLIWAIIHCVIIQHGLNYLNSIVLELLAGIL